MANQAIIRKVRAYARLLRKQKVPFSGVYLFGSFARGKGHSYSDIDVAVISPSFGANCIKEGATLMKLARNVDIRIEPLPINHIEFNEQSSPVAAEILNHGLKVA